MTGVSAPGISASYGYDADGRRVKQTLGSAVTNYLWDEASSYGDVVLETDGNNNTLARYVLGGSELISQTRGPTTSYYLQDGQNSTRALTSSTGAITDTYSYTAFGESLNHTGTTVNPYQYTGQQFDSLTSLYSLRARYYNPALGRFLSQDMYPYNFSNPVELNRYIYTANNPINATDPSGHQASTELGIDLRSIFARARAAVKTVFIAGAIVLLAVDLLLLAMLTPRIQDVPRVIPETTAVPLPAPTIESLDQINMRDQWRQYCQLKANCQPTPGPEPSPGPTPGETNPPPPIPTKTQGPTRRLYHGTQLDAAENILDFGINLAKGVPLVDFGQGFYTTQNYNDAVRLAIRRNDRGSGKPAVLQFDVPIAELDLLTHKVFNSANLEWQQFVYYHRTTPGVGHNYDWVEGPVAKTYDKPNNVTAFPYPEYHQLSIHTPAAAILFERSLTDVILLYP